MIYHPILDKFILLIKLYLSAQGRQVKLNPCIKKVTVTSDRDRHLDVQRSRTGSSFARRV